MNNKHLINQIKGLRQTHSLTPAELEKGLASLTKFCAAHPPTPPTSGPSTPPSGLVQKLSSLKSNLFTIAATTAIATSALSTIGLNTINSDPSPLTSSPEPTVITSPQPSPKPEVKGATDPLPPTNFIPAPTPTPAPQSTPTPDSSDDSHSDSSEDSSDSSSDDSNDSSSPTPTPTPSPTPTPQASVSPSPSPTPTPSPSPCTSAWVSEVISSSQGTKKNGQAISSGRSNPNDTLSSPDEYYFSLGVAGQITLAFSENISISNQTIINVYEITRPRQNYPDELAYVEISPDGSTWHSAGTATNHPAEDDSHGTTSLSLSNAELEVFRYLRLTDTTDYEPHNGNANGFDIDAISITCN